MIPTTRSSRAVAAYPDLAFGSVTATDVDLDLLGLMAQEATADVLGLHATDGGKVADRVAVFAEFFDLFGHTYPLGGQIKAALKKGFPPAPPQVLSLLAAEVGTGILMGVQDASLIDGAIELDVLEAAESFEGMRGQINCTAGEIVVRDASSIVAAYFQGPDKRTAVKPDSTALLYYVFAVPGRRDLVDIGVSWLSDRLSACANEVAAQIADD